MQYIYRKSDGVIIGQSCSEMLEDFDYCDIELEASILFIDYISQYKYVDGQVVLRTEEEKRPELTEFKKNKIRSLRVPKLLEADFLINNKFDNGQDMTSAKAYRQALRDVTVSVDYQTDVAAFVWPVKPE